ncbi:helix-turn-helix domain-containing protein [Streptomyces sp. NBC_01314]|nr:helix-turn-helix domain-containing protein [Streptomyces sp. NBC_01314]
MPVAKIAKVTFTVPDRVRDVIHNFNADGFEALYPKYKGGRPRTFMLPERREIKTPQDGPSPPPEGPRRHTPPRMRGCQPHSRPFRHPTTPTTRHPNQSRPPATPPTASSPAPETVTSAAS